MKKLLEVLLAIVLHPIAVILMWVNVFGRDDLDLLESIVWAVVAIIPLGPVIYVLAGKGDLW